MALQRFMLKGFARFARREQIPGSALTGAVDRLAGGFVDANLGGNLVKQRVARPGAGRSGGWRTIIVYRAPELAVFVHGFAKNATGNVSQKELMELKRLAGVMLELTPRQIRALGGNGAWIELSEYDDDETLQE